MATPKVLLYILDWKPEIPSFEIIFLINVFLFVLLCCTLYSKIINPLSSFTNIFSQFIIRFEIPFISFLEAEKF